MGFFKRFGRTTLLTGGNALSFGVDASGKQIMIGLTTQFTQDLNIQNGKASAYGKGSLALDPAGGAFIVDSDGFWQSWTLTTASPSASPSASVSPSLSRSPSGSGSASASPSHSASPSGSVSPSVSPSASGSPSGSASPSV